MKSINTYTFSPLIILVSILLVGGFDYITGIEIRAYPLYFLPLIMAANSFGKRGALFASFISVIVWMLSNYFGGRVYSHTYIWLINFATQGFAFVFVSLLVADLQDAVVREQFLSRTDALTKLLNNRAFYENANVSLALCHRNQRAATLAFIDLDNFKQVNDTAGHHQGDELLKKFADILMRHCRSSDIVARIGGDEFVIFLPETGATEAGVLLERIRETILSTDNFKVFGVTTSIGAVAYQVAPALIAGMVKEADAMMYSVKSVGKNAVNVRGV